MTAAAPSWAFELRAPPACEPLPPPDKPAPSRLAGGGTTCEERVPEPVRANDPPPPAEEGGGGTGWERMAPLRVLPQLLRSRLTCEGGGATTACAGRESLAAVAASRAGAETGGATTFTVCERVVRELARSCGVSWGAGATTFCASALAERMRSRETSGAGATSVGFICGVARVEACSTSGVGGTMLVFRFGLRRPCACNSGEGATGLRAGRTGATSFDPRPSVGGGPGLDLNARRLATAESLCGRLTLGASTTLSEGRYRLLAFRTVEIGLAFRIHHGAAATMSPRALRKRSYWLMTSRNRESPIRR
jgi:hypothetical protein